MPDNSTKETVLRYYREVWERCRPEVIPSLFADSYQNHAGSRGTLSGPAGIRVNYDTILKSFPDVRFELDDIVCEGQKVVVRYTMRGTHSGEFQGIAPTQKAVVVPGIGIYAIADGLISESWVVRDSLSLLNQIGGR